MKLRFILVMLVVSFAFMGLASAQTCSVTAQSKNTIDLLKEIPTLDGALDTCPKELPFPLSFLFKNEKIVVDISMQDGSNEIIVMEMQNGFLSGMTWGGTGTGYTVSITQCGLDTALSKGGEVYGQLYDSGDLSVSANGWGKKTLLTMMKPFMGLAISSPATPYTIECSPGSVVAAQGTGSAALPRGKPDNCEETYMQGHRGYAENKALWDGYSLDADGVCQVNRGTPSGNCVHTVQLSVSGTPYYLCWYLN